MGLVCGPNLGNNFSPLPEEVKYDLLPHFPSSSPVRSTMATSEDSATKRLEILPKPPPAPTLAARYGLNANWDACLDFTLRRFLYSSLAGAFGGLLFFRGRTARWASLTFGAGIGTGSAYTECSYLLNGSPPKWSPKISAFLTSSQEEQK